VQHMKNAGYLHVEKKFYPGMRHEILNETNKQLVWDDVLRHLNGWMAGC